MVWNCWIVQFQIRPPLRRISVAFKFNCCSPSVVVNWPWPQRAMWGNRANCALDSNVNHSCCACSSGLTFFFCLVLGCSWRTEWILLGDFNEGHCYEYTMIFLWYCAGDSKSFQIYTKYWKNVCCWNNMRVTKLSNCSDFQQQIYSHMFSWINGTWVTKTSNVRDSFNILLRPKKD